MVSSTLDKKIVTGCSIVVLLLVALVAATLAQQWPTPSGWVNDYVGLFSSGEKADLERRITAIEAERGIEISVVAVASTGEYSPKEYAVELFERWGIGKKGADNGLLILIAVDDRRIEVEVGYGLEGILPDGKVGELLDRFFIPEARAGRLGAGVISLVYQLQTILTTDEMPLRAQTSTGSLDALIFGVILLVMVVIFGSLVGIASLSRGGGAKCPQCGRRLRIKRTVLREPTETEDGLQSVEYTCPTCSYHRTTEMILPAVIAATAAHGVPPIIFGPGRGPRRGGGGGGGFGGFGGFGGGRSGGGGAGRSW